MSIPEITTDRLLLRAFRESDFDAYAATMADAEVTRFLADGRPLSRVDAWRQMAMFAGHWLIRGYGIWAVEERATQRFVGRAGCFYPEGWPGFEIAYTFARQAWGKGYATEAAKASLDFAHTALGERDVISVIRPGNVRSIAVAKRLGAARTGSVDFYGSSAEIYRYPAWVLA